MSWPRFNLSRRHKFVVRTTTDYTLNSTTWTNLDTSTDLTVGASVGDVLKAYVNATYGTENIEAFLNACTLVSSAPVNFFGSSEPTATTGTGVSSWIGIAGVNMLTGAPKRYVVQAGDIVSGQVTVRLRYRTASAGNKTLYALTTPFEFAVENIGPQQGT